MTRYSILFLSLFMLTGCEAPVTAADDPCGRSSWVEQIYQQELALFESCGSSATCLYLRQENIDAALAETPDDLDLHQIYQFVRKSHGPEAEERLVEEYRHRSETRGSAADLYLYARLLSNESPQRAALLEESARLFSGYSMGELGAIFAMQGFAGLILFSVFVLMALGLAIIFGQMGVI
ncbi:MAG: hypothetical protein AAF368_08385, partial [Planctomycetota bacterium]